MDNKLQQMKLTASSLGKQPSSAAKPPSLGKSSFSSTPSTRQGPRSPLLKAPALAALAPKERLQVLEQKLQQLRKPPDQPNQQPGPQALVLNPQQPPSPASKGPLPEWRPGASRPGTV